MKVRLKETYKCRWYTQYKTLTPGGSCLNHPGTIFRYPIATLISIGVYLLISIEIIHNLWDIERWVEYIEFVVLQNINVLQNIKTLQMCCKSSNQSTTQKTTHIYIPPWHVNSTVSSYSHDLIWIYHTQLHHPIIIHHLLNF